MSSNKRSVVLAVSGNITIVGIENFPEHLAIADLPAPRAITTSDEKLGEVPLGIYPRFFGNVVEVGFLSNTFAFEAEIVRYGRNVVETIGSCALYPKVYSIGDLDPDRSIFDHQKIQNDRHSRIKSEIMHQIRNRLRK